MSDFFCIAPIQWQLKRLENCYELNVRTYRDSLYLMRVYIHDWYTMDHFINALSFFVRIDADERETIRSLIDLNWLAQFEREWIEDLLRYDAEETYE